MQDEDDCARTAHLLDRVQRTAGVVAGAGGLGAAAIVQVVRRAVPVQHRRRSVPHALEHLPRRRPLVGVRLQDEGQQCDLIW